MSTMAMLQMGSEIIKTEQKKGQWDQGVWFKPALKNVCGTSGCLAGWMSNRASNKQMQEAFDRAVAAGDAMDFESFASRGQHLMGLLPGPALNMFHTGNDMALLQLRICEQLQIQHARRKEAKK